jgi:hypothetical protein
MLELKQASTFFNDLGGSPTGSGEAEYAHLQKDPDDMTSSNQRHPSNVKPMVADLLGSMRLKEPPYYDQRRTVKPLSTPRPLENPKPEADGALTGSPAPKNLQGQGVVSDAIPALPVAMMGMMDELAKSMNTLANRMNRMASQAPQLEPPRKRAPLKPLPLPPPLHRRRHRSDHIHHPPPPNTRPST